MTFDSPDSSLNNRPELKKIEVPEENKERIAIATQHFLKDIPQKWPHISTYFEGSKVIGYSISSFPKGTDDNPHLFGEFLWDYNKAVFDLGAEITATGISPLIFADLSNMTGDFNTVVTVVKWVKDSIGFNKYLFEMMTNISIETPSGKKTRVLKALALMPRNMITTLIGAGVNTTDLAKYIIMSTNAQSIDIMKKGLTEAVEWATPLLEEMLPDKFVTENMQLVDGKHCWRKDTLEVEGL
jgi:hypothetical protein